MPPKIDGDAKPRRQYKLKEKPAEMEPPKEPPKPAKKYVLKKDIEALAKKVARRKVAKALLERIAKKREEKKEHPIDAEIKGLSSIAEKLNRNLRIRTSELPAPLRRKIDRMVPSDLIAGDVSISDKLEATVFPFNDAIYISLKHGKKL